VSGVAVALASSAPPVSTAGPAAATAAERITGRALPPEPSLVHWLTGRLWDLPLALACAAGLVVYGGWVLRAGRTAGAAGAAAGTRRWPARRTLAWVAGVLVLAWATCGGPGLYADVLFSAHTFRLLVLATLVPVLLVLGAPVTLALDVLPTRTDGSRGPREWLTTLAGSRAGRFVADVRVAAPLLVGTLLAFTYTGLLTWSLGSYVGQLTATVLALGSGCLFTNALLRGRSAVGRPASGRVAAAPPERRTLVPFGVVCVCLALLGYVLAGSDVLLAPDWFGLLGRPWGPSAIDDQQRAGVVVWVVSAVWASACAAVLVVRTRSRPPGPGVGPRDRTVR
jgi:putative copper resistance protein D